MRLRIVMFAFACALAEPACDLLMGVHDIINKGPIYFNSFESAEDTVGWQGYGDREFRLDAPAGGGTQSLFVSGGCIAPHAWVEFTAPEKETRLRLKCWGKMLVNRGSVGLFFKDSLFHRGISISVTDSLWRPYQSTDSLVCPANTALRLEMMSGGIIPGAMLVDVVEVTPI